MIPRIGAARRERTVHRALSHSSFLSGDERIPDLCDSAKDSLALRRANAVERLRSTGGVVVAVSGGVDSAVLLTLAVEALGADRVLAATGTSAALPDHDLEDARSIASTVGVELVEVETRELERPGYRANAGDRCFHCRSELFERLESLRRSRRLGAIAYGAIVDDLGDHRPGMRAASDRGVLAPLLEAGLDKGDVREIARRAGLPVTDKPAAACLASRIPTGIQVTPARLDRVGRAEAAMRDLGFADFRVRHHGDVARLELDPQGEARLAEPGIRSLVVEAVLAAGYRFVAVDLCGYRRGSVASRRGDGASIPPIREGGQ